MKKIINVNRHIVAANEKNGTAAAPLSCKVGRGKATYGKRIEIAGPCVIVYSPNAPLSCGARVWIETESPVKVRRRA